ncbi:MAG: glycoside hydrolase, partial [Spirochaetales bacterium]|nr:glycoside hydrolase [Candidatus Physcosoma equi]
MAFTNEKTSLILHGHFYQPPRENPNTGIIPKQPSAAPWSDWNERIYDQCYGANLTSRFLNQDGRIVSLTNNYAYISFNFGPTLLSWLDKEHPEAIEGLRKADRSSVLRLGHGNAMAQGFNHTILPLDKVENAKLQIDWGYQDFQYHFQRDPEGMWLPEC